MSASQACLHKLEVQHQTTIAMIEKRHQEIIDAVNRDMKKLRQEIDDDYMIKKDELLKLIFPNKITPKRKRDANDGPAEYGVNNQPLKKCKSDFAADLNAEDTVKDKSKASYILITKGKYDDDFKATETGACLIWCGQAKRTTHDATVVCGTHIFIRDKGCSPYIYQGVVAQKEIVRPRTKRSPIKLKLMIDIAVPNVGRLCDDIIDTDHFKYQNGCWRTLGLPKFKANGHGIYKI